MLETGDMETPTAGKVGNEGIEQELLERKEMSRHPLLERQEMRGQNRYCWQGKKCGSTYCWKGRKGGTGIAGNRR